MWNWCVFIMLMDNRIACLRIKCAHINYYSYMAQYKCPPVGSLFFVSSKTKVDRKRFYNTFVFVEKNCTKKTYVMTIPKLGQYSFVIFLVKKRLLRVLGTYFRSYYLHMYIIIVCLRTTRAVVSPFVWKIWYHWNRIYRKKKTTVSL